MIILVALKRAGGVGIRWKQYSLLGAGVLGDGLGSLRDGVLGQLTGQEEPDSSLDLPGGDGGPLVVVGKTAGLSSNALKEIIDKGVHDAHGLGGDTGVGVHLLEDPVDIDGIGLLPFAFLLFLVSLCNRLCDLATLVCSLSGSLGGHTGGLVGRDELVPPVGVAVPLCLYKLTPAVDAAFKTESSANTGKIQHLGVIHRLGGFVIGDPYKLYCKKAQGSSTSSKLSIIDKCYGEYRK